MLKEKFDFLDEIIQDVADVRFKRGICCDSIRDGILDDAMDSIFEELSIVCDVEKPLEKYNYLRRYIINDKSLTSEEKIILVRKMTT